MTAQFTTLLADEKATNDLGREFAESLPPDVEGWLVLLQGELGAGKSTFARALIQALGHSGAVPSPTYTLVEPYEIGGRKLYHVDLYRLSDAEELDFLGWSELRDGLALVEWPERVATLAASADIAIELSYEGEARRIEIEFRSERSQVLAEAIA